MARRQRSILALCLFSSAFVTGSAAFGFETVNYSYDALGRLVKVARSGGESSCYSYDEAANRSNVTVATSADCTTASGTPSLSVNDAAVTESATSALLFLVSRTGSSATTSNVNYAVSNGTANTPDYTASSGTLSFAPGQMTKQVSVPITDDAINEDVQTVNFTLSSPSGATIVDGSGVGTINDNDAPPSFSINDAPVPETGGPLILTVTKSGATEKSYSVNYATIAGGTATLGADYTAASGTLGFAPGDVTKTLTVPIIDDSAKEASESIFVLLSGATGGSTISKAQGSGAIIDDENQPPVTSPDGMSVQACKTKSINVVANDSDPNGDTPLTLNYVTSGVHGSASVASSTSVYFEANDLPGTDTLTYVISDPYGAIATGTLSVNVTSALCQ